MKSKATYIIVALTLLASMVMSVISPTPVLADSQGKDKKKMPEVIGEERQVDKYTKVKLDKVNYRKDGQIESKEYTAEITGLPQTLDNGEPIDTQWYKKQDKSGQVYYQSGDNLYIAKVLEDGRVSVTDTETGRINAWTPTITQGLGTYSIQPKIDILDDPLNSYYKKNVIQFTYILQQSQGIFGIGSTTVKLKRQDRLIEGCLTEKYIFESNPGGNVYFRLNTQGDPDATGQLSDAIAFDTSDNPKQLAVHNEGDGFYIEAKEFEDKTYPVIIDPTSSFTTSSYDGFLFQSSGVSWATVQSATTADSSYSSSSASYLPIQSLSWYSPASYWAISRVGIFFNTSALQDDATITSAYIALNTQAVHDEAGSWSVIVQSGAPTYPHTPMVMGDYNQSYYAGNGGSISSSTIGSGYNNIILNSTGRSWINKTGTTRFMLRTSYDVNNSEPPTGTSPYYNTGWQVCSYEYGTNYAPKLYVTYTLPIVPPTTSTTDSHSVGETSATLKGYVSNDGGESCVVSFEYGTTTSYGSISSTSSGYETGDYFNIGITGLSRGTTYHFRSKAVNSAGTGYGLDQTFTTLPAAPTNFTATAGEEQVVLAWTKGTGATNTMVRYKTTGYPSSISDGTLVYNSTGSGTTHTPLTAGTTYYYSAWSSAGSGYSTTYAMAYAVPYYIGAPDTTTRDATAVGTTTATLNGYLDALNQVGGSVTVSFEYGKTVAYGDTAAGGSLSVPDSFYADIVGLDASTLYHFRTKAVGTNGTGYGSDNTFTTSGISAPTVTTSNATAIGLTYATLNGAISDDGGASCTVYFKWGLAETALLNQTDSASGVSSGTPFYYSITGLSTNTTYYYQAVGQNTAGTAYGDVVSFVTTPASAPEVTTKAATNVGATSAVLNAVLTSDGGEDCEVEFEWDDDASGAPYTYSTGWQENKGTGDTFSATITGLTVSTTIYFRAVAQNSGGSYNGTELTFDTVFEAPTDFTAKGLGATTIGLNWGKTGDQTYIIYKTTGFPVDRLDGTQVYFGNTNSYTHSALTAGVTYFYEAWSWEEGDTWSTSSSEDAATTSAVLTSEERETPTILELTEPDKLYQEPSSSMLTKMPGYIVIDQFVDDMGMQSGYFWMIITMFIIVALGAFVYIRTQHMMGVVITVGLGLGFGVMVGTIPGWWLVYFIGICITVPILRGATHRGG